MKVINQKAYDALLRTHPNALKYRKYVVEHVNDARDTVRKHTYYYSPSSLAHGAIESQFMRDHPGLLIRSIYYL